MGWNIGANDTANCIGTSVGSGLISFRRGVYLVAAFALWSLVVVWRVRSTRMGAIALFTCFLVGFVILTYFATVHRGPNWNFYWWPTQWPTH